MDDQRRLLTAMLSWELTAAEWDRIDTTLHAWGRARSAGDDEGCHEALGQLLVGGPRRVQRGINPRLGDASRQRPAERTRDLIARLLESLAPTDPAELDARHSRR